MTVRVAPEAVAGPVMTGRAATGRETARVGLMPCGVWRRAGLTIDGHRRQEVCEVHWIQTPEFFVDLRTHPASAPTRTADTPVPAWCDREYAFAGTTVFERGIIGWTHLLDTDSGVRSEMGRVEWVDGMLDEHGETGLNGRTVPFVEHWLPLVSGEAVWSAVATKHAIRVEVGGYGAELARAGAGFVARRLRFTGAGWITHGEPSRFDDGHHRPQDGPSPT